MIPFDYDQYQWNSRTKYPDGTKRPWNPDKWVIHWGGRTNPGDSIEHEMSVLRGWQRYHIDTKGWTDIAYNYAIGNSGMIYRLRGENRSGATSGDYDNDGIPENAEARAVVWLGGLGYTISTEAYGAMGRIINAQPMPVTVHFDHKATACPGQDWAAWRDNEGWEDGGTVTLPPPDPEGHEMRTVRNGAGSNANPDATVAAAQAGMTIHGFRDLRSIAENGADGIFRSGTETQTKNFQQAKGLVIDGVVGNATWVEIDKE